jgi:single-stranded-DNA-specific exonuclease
VLVEGSVASARAVKGGHLKLELTLPGAKAPVISGFGIGMGDRADLAGPVRLLGRLRRDTWRGGDAVELRVDAVVS